MASIKIKFRPSKTADREGTIYYQILHERQQRQCFTDYHVYPHEWDGKQSSVAIRQDSRRLSELLAIREEIRRDIARLNRIITRLEHTRGSYTVAEILEEFRNYKEHYSLFAYLEKTIQRLRENGKIRTAETYRAALNSFRKFRDGQDIMLDSLNSETMEAFEAWHTRKGNVPNTISFYTRILRAVYNRAVEEEIIENLNPFRRVYTGVDKTVKRALPLEAIQKIYTIDLSDNPELDYARDMFMMSFMLRWMSFIDMTYLRKTDLSGGHVSYRRRKTGQLLSIEWTVEMQRVLDKYPPNESDYLLPIIRRKGINERNAYRNIGYNINRNLKRVAEKAGLHIALTLYVARHSWASIARTKGIPISVISEGMGHDSEATTQIYLASLSTTAVDQANSLILKSL